MANINNKVSFGLSNGHYAIATPGENGIYTFGEVVKFENLISMSASIIGGKTDVYADNKVVASLSSYAGQELTLTLTEVPESFKIDVLGYKKDSDGALCEITNAQAKTFAFGFQVEGDVKARRTWMFLCTATNSADSSSTKGDTPEANNPEITFTVKPLAVGEDEVLKKTCAKGDAGYDSFFSSVKIPAFVQEQSSSIL